MIINNFQTNLARYINETHYEDLNQFTVVDMKYRLLDWIGCAIAGLGREQHLVSRLWANQFLNTGDSLVLGEFQKYYAPEVAAFLNGIIGHTVELDDGHRIAIGHPGAVVIPTVFSIASMANNKITGKELITAIAIGYDTFIRIGSCLNPSHYKYFHTTGTAGIFASMSAAASLMKLSHEEVLNAIGLAGTMAAGLIKTFGTHAKVLNIGQACQNGVKAATLAKMGFDGPKDLFNGEADFFSAFDSSNNKQFLEYSLNNNIASTAFYKKYASCGHTNSGLDVIFELREKHKIEYKKIHKITVSTYAIAEKLTGKFCNTDEDAAKFSLPYCISVAMIFNRVSLQEFKPEILKNKDVVELAQKITVTEDAVATNRFPKRRASLEVKMIDGSKYIGSVEDANDIPDYELISNKFIGLTSDRLKEASSFFDNCINNIEENASLLFTVLSEYLVWKGAGK